MKITINPDHLRVAFPLVLEWEGDTRSFEDKAALCANLENFDEPRSEYMARDTHGHSVELLIRDLEILSLRKAKLSSRSVFHWMTAHGDRDYWIEYEEGTATRAIEFRPHGDPAALPGEWNESTTVEISEKLEEISLADFERKWLEIRLRSHYWPR